MTKKGDNTSSSTTIASSPSWTGVEYLDRFEKSLEEIFIHIMQCPEHDKVCVIIDFKIIINFIVFFIFYIGWLL